MNIKSSTALAIAAAFIALPLACFAQAGNAQSSKAAQNTSASSSARQEAAKMVSADAIFTTKIDSQKMPPGSQFQAKLLKKVRLDNGPELPAGTLLVGRVTTDNTHRAGLAKLALRFTQADLKDGQTVPIKATIVDVYNVPNDLQISQYGVPSGPIAWAPSTLAVDQIGVLSGVDLHSNIANRNSGVFVSTKKDDIKLSNQTGVELAIAQNGETGQPSAGGM